MSDEAAFTGHLAQHPEDETARGAYADWLDEHDRGEEAARQRRMGPGYRALVVRNFQGVIFDALANEVEVFTEGCSWTAEAVSEVNYHAQAELPSDWLDLMDFSTTEEENRRYWRDYPNREDLFDAAALAFADLPAARQAELLAAAPAEASA